SGTGDRDELVPDGSGLTARNEKQTVGVYNTNGGSFTLQFGSDPPIPVAWSATGTTLRDNIAAALNGPSSTLSGSLTDSATSLTVANGSVFPTGSFRIRIDSETILVGSRSGNTLNNLTRGAEGTTAATHSGGAVNLLSTITAGGGVTVTGTGPFTVEFTGAGLKEKDVNDLVADATDLVGALDNGRLVGNVNFTGSIYNGPSVVVVTTRDGVTDVTTTTLEQGSAVRNELQQISVANAIDGTFTITFDADRSGTIDAGEMSGVINVGDDAAAVQTALEQITALTGKIAVAQTGGTYLVGFNGTL